jgi:predicted ribosome quality control (RQC) complex YloA/Tae2 family protein
MKGFAVELDPSRSLSGNAQLYYRRAKKAKETLKLNEINQAQAEKDLSDVRKPLSCNWLFAMKRDWKS